MDEIDKIIGRMLEEGASEDAIKTEVEKYATRNGIKKKETASMKSDNGYTPSVLTEKGKQSYNGRIHQEKETSNGTDELRGIVKRMVEAGEPEENIALVIRHLTSRNLENKKEAPQAESSNGFNPSPSSPPEAQLGYQSNLGLGNQTHGLGSSISSNPTKETMFDSARYGSPVRSPEQIQSDRLNQLQDVYNKANPKYATQPKPMNQAEEGSGNFVANMAKSFNAGVNSTLSSIAKTPAFLYDLAAMPQNKLADLLDRPSLEASSKNFGSNPLAEWLDDQANAHHKEIQEKFGSSITQNLKEGKFGDAFNLAANQITESIPTMLAIGATGASSAGARIAGMTGVFGADKYNQIKDSDLSQPMKILNATLSGLAEGVPEYFGTSKLLKIGEQIYKQGSKEASQEFVKNSFSQVYERALKRYYPIVGPMSEAIEEMSTQISQNAVDKWSGIDPERKLTDGVLDAGIVGLGAGAAFTTPTSILDQVRRKGVTDKQAFLKDSMEALNNPEVPDNIKEVLKEKIAKESVEIGKALEAEDAIKEKYTPAEKELTEVANKELSKLNTALQNPNLPDTIKAGLQEEFNNNFSQLEEIHKRATERSSGPSKEDANSDIAVNSLVDFTDENGNTISAPVTKVEGNQITVGINNNGKFEEKQINVNAIIPKSKTPSHNSQITNDNTPVDTLPTEGMKVPEKSVQESKNERIIAKPRGIRSLVDTLKKVFGLSPEKAESSAKIHDKVMRTIAKRTGKTPTQAYEAVQFVKADEETQQKLRDAKTPEERNTILENALFQIIGKRGARRISPLAMGNLERAERLIYEGKDEKEVWQQTGWKRDKDVWKMEIPDGQIKDANKLLDLINNSSKGESVVGRMEDYFDAPLLYKAYPTLRDAEIVSYEDNEAFVASYDIRDKRIYINRNGKTFKEGGLLKNDGLRSAIAHELEHGIQRMEGMDGGSNIQIAKRELISRYRDEAFREAQKTGLDENSLEFSRHAEQYIAEKEGTKNFTEAVVNFYKSKGGEVDARNVQTRLTLSDLERAQTPLSETEEFPNKEKNYDTLDKRDPLYQEIKGAVQLYENGEAIIHALTDPDVSTPMHELAHIYEQYLTPQEIKTIEKWSSNKSGTTEFSEAFAEGFEAYLQEGKAPDSKLKKIFDQFKEWLNEIYSDIARKDLNKPMQKVYDAMLGYAPKPLTRTEQALYNDPRDMSEAVLQRLLSGSAISTESFVHQTGFGWRHEDSDTHRIRKATKDETTAILKGNPDPKGGRFIMTEELRQAKLKGHVKDNGTPLDLFLQDETFPYDEGEMMSFTTDAILAGKILDRLEEYTQNEEARMKAIYESHLIDVKALIANSKDLNNHFTPKEIKAIFESVKDNQLSEVKEHIDRIIEGELLSKEQAETLEKLAKNFTTLEAAYDQGGEDLVTTINNTPNDPENSIKRESQSIANAIDNEENRQEQTRGSAEQRARIAESEKTIEENNKDATGQTDLFQSINTENEFQVDSQQKVEELEETFTADQESESQETLEKLEDFGVKIGGARKDTSTLRNTKNSSDDTRPSWAKKYAILSDKNGTFQVAITKGNFYRTVKSGFTTEQGALEALPLIEVSRNHRVYKKAEGNYAIYRVYLNGKTWNIFENLPTREDAMRYMAENAEEIIKKKSDVLDRPHLDNVVRNRKDYREGKNVTPEKFIETFGFRGGEFGNWLAADERQSVLNMAYDSFLDLSEVLNVSPKTLSLDGELSIGFGSRGQGSKSGVAHYEAGRAVINQTKIKGAGSLAHEWFHAFDNYLAKQDGKITSERNEDGTFPSSTEKRRYYSHGGLLIKSGVRKEVEKAFNVLYKTITQKSIEIELDVSSMNQTLDTRKETLSRDIARLKNYIAKERTYGKKRKPATTEQLEKFDSIVAKILDGNLGTKQWYSSGRSAFKGNWHYPTVKELYESVSDVTGKKLSEGSFIDGKVEALKRITSDIENAQKSATRSSVVKTDFMKGAQTLDESRAGAYWSSPHELMARGFESFIEDKIAEGGASQYLVYGTSNLFYGDLSPYPSGQERIDINNAFQKLFDTLETKKSAKGNDILFQTRIDLQKQQISRQRMNSLEDAIEQSAEKISKTNLQAIKAKVMLNDLNNKSEGQEALKIETRNLLNEFEKDNLARSDKHRELEAELKEVTKSYDLAIANDAKQVVDEIIKTSSLNPLKALKSISGSVTKLQEKMFAKHTRAIEDLIAEKFRLALDHDNNLIRVSAQLATSVFNGLPRSNKNVIDKLRLKGGLNASTFYAGKISDQLYSLVGNNPDSLERVHSVMDPETANVDLFNDQVTFEELTPKEQELYKAVRDILDNVHRQNYALGFITKDVYEKYEGIYVPRFYESYEIPPEIDKLIDEQARYNPVTKLNDGGLQTRKEWDEVGAQIKNELIKDPVYGAVKRLMQLDQNSAIMSYMHSLISEKIVKDENPPKGYVQLNGKGYGPLNGKYVPTYIAEDFKGFFFMNKSMNDLYDTVKAYDRLTFRQFLKKSYTVYSPSVQAGNFVSNFVFGFANGIEPVTFSSNIPKAIQEIKSEGTVFQELMKAGLIYSDTLSGDLLPLIHQRASLSKSSILKGLDKFDKVATAAYGGSDNLAKVNAYMIYKDQGFTNDQAIQKVYEGFQNYATVGKFWDVLSKTPLVGPVFVKFQADLLRIMKNGAIKSPLTTSLYLYSLWMLPQMLKSIGLNDEDKEKEDLRTSRPFVPKTSILFKSIPLVYNTPVGELNLARYLSPFYVFDGGETNSSLGNFGSKLNPIQMVEVEGYGKGNKQYMPYFADPLLGTLTNTLFLGIDFRGKSIADPEATRYQASGITEQERLNNKLKFLMRNWVPQGAQLHDSYLSFKYGEDYYGRTRSLGQTLLNLVVKVQNFDDGKYNEVANSQLNRMTGEYKALITERKGVTNSINKQREASLKLYDQRAITERQLDARIEELDLTLKKRLDESYSAEDDLIQKIETFEKKFDRFLK